MNLYDEAIFELEENVRINGNCIGYYAIKKALERTKKVEELLELYKELSFIRKFEYKKQEPSETEKLCMKQIKALEEELK